MMGTTLPALATKKCMRSLDIQYRVWAKTAGSNHRVMQKITSVVDALPFEV